MEGKTCCLNLLLRTAVRQLIFCCRTQAKFATPAGGEAGRSVLLTGSIGSAMVNITCQVLLAVPWSILLDRFYWRCHGHRCVNSSDGGNCLGL